MALGKEFKKNLCRGPILALGKGLLCRGPSLGPSAKAIYKKKLAKKLVLKKSLPRAWSRALGKDLKKLSNNLVAQEKKIFAEGLTGGPRQSLTGNGRRDPTGLICRGPRPSAKI